jgi:serine phosphatase RsbU (regulator of sigma subunit)/anti-sigma regulatory factor (Ser/Thr protein kinase)
MMIAIRNFWQNLFEGREKEAETQPEQTAVSTIVNRIDLDIAPNDPLVSYFRTTPGVVDIRELDLKSAALSQLREAGVVLVVPLMSQGELIGMINLGPRLSEQEYSADDRKLLNDLATQAAPAVRVAQLVRQQQAEALERGRIEQELKIAAIIQQTLLPKSLPAIDGYEVAAYYQPAREVGGDFYEFLYLDDGRIAFIIGDVTDKGVPAALVMATTRTLLRAAAERLTSPGAVLERVNDLLEPDIPARMFVTCLYALLDPKTGLLQFANAGHDLPYRAGQTGTDELHARGMPLGLMPGMTYEEKTIQLNPGDTVLLYSDGLAEAHAPDGEMFGFPRVKALLDHEARGQELIDYLLSELADFTGEGWEQEDDVTLVTLQYKARPEEDVQFMNNGQVTTERQTVATFELPSQPGNERQAMEKVAELVGGMNLGNGRLEKLKTAVAEATMNAMEHGNKYDKNRPVRIEVQTSSQDVAVRITDEGGGPPEVVSETPDLAAKLAGEQSPRGWGLFLIQNMVDEMNVTRDEQYHTIELVLNLESNQ